MKVLIVDDEAIVRRALVRALGLDGVELKEAENGEEGVELWLQWDPDVVMLDVLMPKMSGPDVLKKMQGKSRAKVVLMSAHTGHYDLDAAKRLGAHLFVAKPFEDIFALVKLIRELGHGKS